MQTDQSLIDKFLENRCSAEEAKQVHQYLNEHPEVLQELYRNDWRGADGETPLRLSHSAAMFKVIEEDIRIPKKTRLHYLSWAAAAVLVAAVSLWWYQTTQTDAHRVEQIARVIQPVKQLPVAGSWLHEKNNSTNKRVLRLPDGSVVTLSAAASVRYMRPPAAGKRDVYLDGEALFEVVKDTTRPFTVYSGSLSTTALGTSFKITSTSSIIRVQLLTGKVVIRAVKEQLAGWNKAVYLLPGQQLQYDATTSVVKVSGAGTGRAPVTPAVAAYDPGEGMVFDNTPLQEVLDKLKQQYKVTISYTPEELRGLSFSGTIYRNDSLPVLLQAIGRMNDLSVTTVADSFSITKVPN